MDGVITQYSPACLMWASRISCSSLPLAFLKNSALRLHFAFVCSAQKGGHPHCFRLCPLALIDTPAILPCSSGGFRTQPPCFSQCSEQRGFLAQGSALSLSLFIKGHIFDSLVGALKTTFDTVLSRFVLHVVRDCNTVWRAPSFSCLTFLVRRGFFA